MNLGLNNKQRVQRGTITSLTDFLLGSTTLGTTTRKRVADEATTTTITRRKGKKWHERNLSVFTNAILLLSLWQLNLILLQPQAVLGATSSMTNLFARMRVAKIANIEQHIMPPLATTTANILLPAKPSITNARTTTTTKNPSKVQFKKLPTLGNASNRREDTKLKASSRASEKQFAGKYEIHSVSGEPNYKSVNLTWEVEFLPAVESDSANNAVTNNSVEVEPPQLFQVFYCELQSFGPHRCRSKLVDARQHVELYDNNEHNDTTSTNFRKVRHYWVMVENLRMATKYSFHIRSQTNRRNMKITGRSEIFGNEIDDETLVGHTNFDEQTIIIPTKGFSAQATKCLPHASEIEVETGPYFAGKIVVDGGNCGVKGNPLNAMDKYTMRIDHKQCKSLVKPETNTVETFITVQENLGIFTHSTRRFVVVCSYQSGMQTVRASFTVPGKDGVAAAVENDPFEPDDDRMGRRLRPIRYVNKSALILRENYDETNDLQSKVRFPDTSESLARVQEIRDPGLNAAADLLENDDAAGAVAVLEDIVPHVNERNIKHEVDNELQTESTSENADDPVTSTLIATEKTTKPVAHARQTAKYAKLVGEPVTIVQDEYSLLNTKTSPKYTKKSDATNIEAVLLYFVTNMGSLLLLLALTVILVACGIVLTLREFRRVNHLKQQQHEQPRKQQQQQQQQRHKHLEQCNSISSRKSSSHALK